MDKIARALGDMQLVTDTGPPSRKRRELTRVNFVKKTLFLCFLVEDVF